ncbi:HAD-IIIC family phosphatase [Streptomyces sp. NRRL B-1347]|uniref:HAD-IIIC family phosphatase n=1 Tax=Streptomyces sp. NRRL B-1347 TaxID=1476877 RepID=UPI0006913DDF|nr:HAD-IIIC family phosphatase [Streptomyces sp. NRRL B-1347]
MTSYASNASDLAVTAPGPAAGYDAWYRASVRLTRQPPPVEPVLRELEVAVLATFTTDLLNELLPVAGLPHRMLLRPRRLPFGQIEQLLAGGENAPLRARGGAPGYVVLAGTAHDLLPADAVPGDAAAVEKWAEAAVARWTGLWDAATALGSQVIQLGFVAPAPDPLAHALSAAPAVAGSLTALVRRVNDDLAERATGRVRFVATERLVHAMGTARWSDPRHWYRLRQPVSLEALPVLAAAVADAVAVDTALTPRCVVVDLDGTLWHGVLGQDGIDGVAVGGGRGPVGEAHADFQRFLRGLRAGGIALAVCSKNDPDLAHRALAQVPGMVLGPGDFAAVSASWEPKSRQLARLAGTLRLGLDSMVFVDDNPAERAEVAAALPEVRVVPLPGAPAEFAAAVAATPGLVAGAGSADALRGQSYAALARAAELAGRAPDLGTYLRGLRMRSRLAPIDATTLPRAAELVARTNQFNLTTRRRTQAELTALVERPGTYAACLALTDRFADHGVVGVVIAVLGEDGDGGRRAEIDTLLLSCRVIGRTAEQDLVAAAGRWAAARGAVRLVGRYRPTNRNALVESLYADLDFTPLGSDEQGSRAFQYDLRAGAPARSPYIEDVTKEETDAR